MNTKKILKINMKHISLLILSFAMVFGFGSKAFAWDYSGADILYTVSVNDAPTVDAGPDKFIVLPTTSASATGSATDPDGSIATTFWEFVSGPATASVGAQNNSTPSTVTLSGMTVAGGMSIGGAYTFRFNAQDNNGVWGWDEMQVFVSDPGSPSGSISATDCTIALNASSCNSSVSWSTANLTANPTEVTHNNPATTSVSSATSGTNVSSTVNYGSTTFFLYHNGVLLSQDLANASCIGGSSWNGTICASGPLPTPSVTLNAGPSTVFSGSASTLSWTSTNVSSCVASAVPASGSWTGARGVTSSFPHESTGPLSATTTFRLDCTGVNGNASDTATVTVVPASGSNIIAELTADPGAPNKINLGDSSTLSWSSSNATSCSGIGFATGGATSGSISVSPTVNTTYTLTCTNASNSASDTATVLLKRKFLFIEF